MKRILIVHADEELCKMVVQSNTTENIVDYATTFESAMSKLKENHYDHILQSAAFNEYLGDFVRVMKR